jgi:diacylglycerol kinase (ATP)
MKKSFTAAFRGVAACVRTERNFRCHLALSFYVVVSAAVTEATRAEWIAVLVCIGAVTGAELFNTAAEKLCDTLHPDRCEGIGRVKDMAAGGVLMLALASAVIGGLIFFNEEKLTKFFAFTSSHVVLTVLILATLPLNIFLVFRRYGNDKKNRHDHDRRASERR